MYAKHQYIQESECGSTMVRYIFQLKEYKYIVITECDPILHEYYITKGTKYRLQGMKNIKMLTRYKKEILLAVQERARRKKATTDPFAP